MRNNSIKFIPLSPQEEAQYYGKNNTPNTSSPAKIQFQPLTPQEVQKYYGNKIANTPTTAATTKSSSLLPATSQILSAASTINPAIKNTAIDTAKLIGASGLNLGKQLINLGAEGLNKIAPNLVSNPSPITGSPLNAVDLPNNSLMRGGMNLGSGIGSMMIPGLDVVRGEKGLSLLGRGLNSLSGTVAPQAIGGAALDNSNRAQGAEVGGALGVAGEALGGIKNAIGTGKQVLENAKNITAMKNAALEANKQNASDNLVTKFIATRSANRAKYPDRYSITSQAPNAPIPGLQAPSGQTGETLNQMREMFGNDPASQFLEQNPEHFESNYTPEEGFESPTANVDKFIVPGFSDKAYKQMSSETNFGTADNPVQPMKDYETFVQNPVLQNATQLRKSILYARKSNLMDSMPGMKALFNTAAHNIDKNMIISALENHDAQYGTSLASTYKSASPFWKQEKEWEEISPQFDSLTNGNWLPGSTDYNSVSNVLSNAAKNGSINSGSFIHNEASKFQAALAKNTQKQAANTNALQKRILNISQRRGLPVRLGNLAGFSKGLVSAGKPLALGALPTANQPQQ